MDPTVEKSWELFKTFGPLLTGGLAGAILTFLVNQRTAKRRLPRLTVAIRRIDYSVPNATGLRQLRVSYGAEAYEQLAFFSMSIHNDSSRSADKTPFLITIPASATIVDKSFAVHPVNRLPMWEAVISDAEAYLWDSGELKPGDSAELRLLLTEGTDVRWSFRGSDDVRIYSLESEPVESNNSLVIVSALWIAVFVAVGAIPYISALFRAGLIVLSLPFALRAAERMRGIITQWRRRQINSAVVVNTAPHDRLQMNHDASTGILSLQIRGNDTMTEVLTDNNRM
jgi:hypothetical protein